jgi:hypothetical protein
MGSEGYGLSDIRRIVQRGLRCAQPTLGFWREAHPTANCPHRVLSEPQTQPIQLVPGAFGPLNPFCAPHGFRRSSAGMCGIAVPAKGAEDTGR